MTLDELKREAERQGYSLVRKQPPLPKLQTCLCGRKLISIWHRCNPEEYRASCPKCGFGEENEWSATPRRAREIWNESIERSWER